jgi:hypothetical protein
MSITTTRPRGSGARAVFVAILLVLLVGLAAVGSSGVSPALAAGPGFVTGTVNDAAGQPAPLHVIAFPVGSNTVAGATPSVGFLGSPPGGYRLGPLPEGQYHLLAKTDLFGGGHWGWQWYGGHSSRAASPPVTVTADGSTDAINFTVQPGGRFTGRVAASDRHPIGCCSFGLKGLSVQPLLNVEVTVRSVDLARDVGAATSAFTGPIADMGVTGDNYLYVDNGKYRAYGLQSGAYRIQVRPQLRGYTDTWFAGGPTEADADPVAATVAATVTPPMVEFAATRRHLWPTAKLTWDGTPRAGRTLRIADSGTWNKRPDSYRYFWRLADGRQDGRTLRVKPRMKTFVQACVTARRDGFVKGTQCRGITIRSDR